MADQYDIFFDGHDGFPVDHTRPSATINVSGATVLQPEGTAFTWKIAPSPALVVGQRALLWDLASGFIQVRVKKVTDATHATLIPIQSVADTASLPYTLPDNSQLIVVDEVSAQQVIDLSEAPSDSYDYLFVSCATIEQTLSPGEIQISMRVGAFEGDPYSGTGAFGDSRLSLSGANPDRVNFVAATKQTLLGGQRYEQSINFNEITAGGTAEANNARILALRVTGGYFAGDGKTVEQTTLVTASYVDVVSGDLGANLPAGDYLIVATWDANNSNIANRFDVVLEQTAGGIVLANHVGKPNVVTDYPSAGFFGVVTLGATNRVRLRFKASATTAKIKNVFLAAIPIANIPALAAAQASQDLSTNVSQVATGSFAALNTSGAVTLTAGRHIEVVSASVGGSLPIRARPTFANQATSLGNHNVPPFGTAVTDFHPTFWLIRNERVAGSTQNSIEGRRNTASATTIWARDFTYSWLREQPTFRPLPDEEMAIVADIEMGGLVLKYGWNSTTLATRFSHRLDETMLSRVMVNGSAYTRVATLAAMAVGTWFWDPSMKDVYVQLTTAHAALGAGTPAAPEISVVVVPLLLASRGVKENLIDSFSGVPVPYLPLLKDAPGFQQTLQSTNVKFSAASQIGTLKLISQDGRFDDKLGRPFDGYRVKVRRGYTRKTRRIDDFEVIADCVQGPTSHDIEGGVLSLRLLDRRRLMQTPIANTRVTVREGFGSDGRNREGQPVKVIWGEVLRLEAFRLTSDETLAGWNEYQFVDHAVKSVSAVYIDGTTRVKIAGANLNVTSTYIGLGKVRVNNAVWPVSGGLAQPGDKVYVDMIGRTNTGLTSGTALQTEGAIARDIATNVLYGNTAATRLVERSFRMIDRTLRWQQVPTIGRRPAAPKVALIADEKMTVENAFSKLTGDTASLWLVNHQDRLGLDVPDFERGNLIVNGGFEDDLYPWFVKNSATLIATLSRKYEGTRSAEISNGTPNALACAAQDVVLAAGGIHVVTLLASVLEGESTAFRIGVIGPSGVETLSEAQTLETGKWTRHSVVYTSEPGDAGHTEIRIYPAYGSVVATRVAVDRVELYRVACVIDQVRSRPESVETEDEHYFDCEVPFGRNLQDTAHISTRRVGEPEARGLSSLLEPEGKFAIQSSTRAELPDTLAADADSAGGLAAPVALLYSRTRMVLGLPVYGLDRIPLVGDYVFHQFNPRVPESPDGYPIWRISDVAYDEDNAKVIKLKVWHHNDPVADRIDISPDNVPMGAIAPTRSPNAITDLAEVTDLLNQFVMGTRKPTITTQRGDLYHKHPLDHDHPVGSAPHVHSVTLNSHGIDAAGSTGTGLVWSVEFNDLYQYPASIGPQEPVAVTRGKTGGGHLHSVPGTPANVVAATGTSSQPNTPIETAPGPNEPSYRRVRFMQRIANTTNLISADLIVGFLTASLPAGWTRVKELDGLWLRGANTNGPLSTTTTATFVPTDTGSTLALTSGTGVYVGRRLTVTKSGSTVHVVVTAGAGLSWTVIPLHETSDVANGSFPSGSAATVTADSEVLIRTNVATSTYVPNDAGSTLIVASGTGIAVGSLLSITNTADSDKLVHVRVTAGAGTSWTVVPLHLAGDQANGYSPGFPAGATTKVTDSEFIAPTHKHAGLMPAHIHAAGGHVHAAASFLLGGADSGRVAQKFLGGASETVGIAAVDGHAHIAKITAPADNTNSSSAAGTIADDLQPSPPYIEIVWAVSDGTQTTIPASGILLWAQSDTPPGGWARLGAAKDLMLKGAAAGASPGSSAGGHVHTQTNTTHTIAHAHGGTAIQPSEKPEGGDVLIDAKTTAALLSVAAGPESIEGGHAHQVTATIGSTSPTGGLVGNSNSTGDATTPLPYHREVMLIQKS